MRRGCRYGLLRSSALRPRYCHPPVRRRSRLQCGTYAAANDAIYLGDDYTQPRLGRLPLAAWRAQIADQHSTGGGGAEQPGAAGRPGRRCVAAARQPGDQRDRAARGHQRHDRLAAWLDSTPGTPAINLVASGGHLNIQNITVTSWQTISNTIDLNYADGRSYLLAQYGGRMDIVGAEVAYLGYADGQPSGLAWRRRATDARPETGATGSIVGSNIHNNYSASTRSRPTPSTSPTTNFTTT